MEKINTLKPDYKIMKMILNQCLRLNGGKAMFMILLCSLIRTFLYALPASPVVPSAMNGSISMGVMIFSCAFMIFISALDLVIDYGKQVMFSKYVERTPTTIGNLFSGFRNGSGKIFCSALLLSVLNFMVGVMAGIVTWKVFYSLGLVDLEKFTDTSFEDFFVLLGKFIMVVGGVVYLVRIPFVFLWLVLYRRPDLKILQAMGISVKLLFKNFFHFAGFVILSAGMDLVFLVVMAFVNRIVPYNAESIFAALFFNILSFAFFIAQLKVIVRVGMAIPVYFYSMTGVLEVHKSEYVDPSTVPASTGAIEQSSTEKESGLDGNTNPESEQMDCDIDESNESKKSDDVDLDTENKDVESSSGNLQ